MTRTIDGEIVVLDQQRGFVHRLNTSASRIWTYCDGTRPLQQLAEAFALDVGLPADEVLADVASVIAEFDRLQLLTS